MCLQPRYISINANICAIIACFQKLSFSRGYRGHLRALPASGTEEQVLCSLSALEVVDFDGSGIMKAVVAALSFLQQSDTDGCFQHMYSFSKRVRGRRVYSRTLQSIC